MSSTFSRRRFIAGTSALAAGTGLLSLMNRQALAGGGAPKRVVFWYGVEGTVGEAFWPGSGPGAFTINSAAVMGNNPQSKNSSINGYRSSERGTWILGPMKPHEADMNLVSGMTTQMGNADGDHRRAVQAVLAGGMTGQGSIDQHLGHHLQGSAPFHATYASLMGQHVKENIATFCGPVYTTSGNVVAPTWNPVTTYNQVFPTGTGNPDEQDHTLESKLRLVGSVRERLDEVHLRGGIEARDRMEAYLSSIELIESQTEGLIDSVSDVDVTVEIPPQWAEIDDGNKYWQHSPNFGPLGKIMMDTTVASLALDRTRVATMQWSASGDDKGPADGSHYGTLGIDLEGNAVQDHQLGHQNDNLRRRNQARVFRWYYEQLAYFVERLKAIPEGDGTLFDNTIIIVCSEFGGYNHNFNDAPFVTVGSAGGTFKTGSYYDLHSGGFRLYGDAWLGIARGFGLELGSLGHADSAFDEFVA